MIFPKVIGSNLETKNYTLPLDFESKLNIAIIAFRRSQQALVDQWTFFLSVLEYKYQDVRYYELPTISTGYKFMSFMIDGGMRAGIPDKSIRERTITLYIDKSKFKKELHIDSDDTIYIFLVRPNGEILWKTKGEFDEKKGEELELVIRKLYQLNQ